MECHGHPRSIFVDQNLESFICAVCLDVCEDPEQCKNGHIFCHNCCLKMDPNKACPTCRTGKVSEFGRNIFAKNQIDCLFVKCVCFESSAACGWQGPLLERNNHEL